MGDIIEKSGFERPELIASSGGAFELRREGILLFSKLREHRFPTDLEVIDLIKSS